MKPRLSIVIATIVLFFATIVASYAVTDPLPSWNDGKSKSAIIHFVEEITKEGSPNYVPQPERIATFDNDGTLWVEQPMYVQLLFVQDRVKALAPVLPARKPNEPLKSAIAGDLSALISGGEKAFAELTTAAQGTTVEDFGSLVKQWLATTEDARFKRHYPQLVYQPMLELLAYLRSNGFKTYIVSGGGVEFVRAYSEKTYGIPPEQVIGSTAKLKFEYRNGKPAIIRRPELDFVDDKDGKPVGIQRVIGRRPIAAFGNSDGDLEMLQWTAAGSRPHFCLFVHHTDAVREYAYDRQSKVGKLDKGLDEAAKHDWTVVDMRHDWKIIFPE